MRSLVPLYWRDWFFTKNPCTGDFSKTPVLEEIDFFLKNPYRENNIPVVGSILWCVESLKYLQNSLVCGYFVIFKVPLCVGSALCGV